MLSYPSPSKLFANLFVILLCMGQVVDDIFVTNIGFVPLFEQKIQGFSRIQSVPQKRASSLCFFSSSANMSNFIPKVFLCLLFFFNLNFYFKIQGLSKCVRNIMIEILCFVSLCRYFWTALSSVKYSHCWSIAFIKKKDVIGKTSLENER